ncbi:putative protein without homology [Propionibacterium freudenreichii subsp. shermanii]|nr:putative protein without homology [Propionibacterium freudenreichii subsp. shermanii]
MDGHCRVEVAAVAGGLAGVIAHAAVDGGERIVAHELSPCGLRVRFLDQPQPLLAILARRASVVTGGQQVNIDGHPRAHRSNATFSGREVGQLRDVATFR